MKKLLVTTILTLALCPAFAETIMGFDVPEWKDFAPPAYVNVTAPKGLGKFNDVATYWYRRKVEFENLSAKCYEMPNSEEKFTCYQNLKVKQYQKNSDYNARLEAMDKLKSGPQEIQDPTNNMFPIGDYINHFTKYQANELY